MAFSRVDFPAFGNPTRPMSAINFSSSLMDRLSPFSPQNPCALLPPSPPLATTNSEFGSFNSPTTNN